MIVGDFNCPTVDWECLTAHGFFDMKLLNVILDVNLIQHVKSPTRLLPGQSGSTLDLVLTSGLDVEDLKILSPIGHSDHMLLSFVWNKQVQFNSARKTYTNVWRTNFEGLLKAAESLQWEIPEGLDVDRSWIFLKAMINRLCDDFVPTSVRRKRAVVRHGLTMRFEKFIDVE